MNLFENVAQTTALEGFPLRLFSFRPFHSSGKAVQPLDRRVAVGDRSRLGNAE